MEGRRQLLLALLYQTAAEQIQKPGQPQLAVDDRTAALVGIVDTDVEHPRKVLDKQFHIGTEAVDTTPLSKTRQAPPDAVPRRHSGARAAPGLSTGRAAFRKPRHHKTLHTPDKTHIGRFQAFKIALSGAAFQRHAKQFHNSQSTRRGNGGASPQSRTPRAGRNSVPRL